MARATLYNYIVADDGSEATFHMRDGSTIRIVRDNLSPETLNHALWFGIKQSVADAAAIARDTETGASASDADKIDAMRRRAEQLPNGWYAVRGTGEGAATGLLFRALCELYSHKTREEVREFMSKLDKKQQAALRANARVAPIIERLRAATAPDIDTDAMLGELDD